MVTSHQNPRYIVCVRINPRNQNQQLHYVMDPQLLFTKISLNSPFPYLFPFPILRKKKKNYKVNILLQMPSTTHGNDLLHQHSHRKMSKNSFLLLGQYQAAYHQANLTSTTTNFGSYKFSFGAPTIV